MANKKTKTVGKDPYPKPTAPLPPQNPALVIPKLPNPTNATQKTTLKTTNKTNKKCK